MKVANSELHSYIKNAMPDKLQRDRKPIRFILHRPLPHLTSPPLTSTPSTEQN